MSKYSEEFKLKIVKEHKETHIGAESLQRKYGVHHSQIVQWIAQFELTGAEELLLNSVMENFFGLLKSELLYLQTFEYVEWYNEKRIMVKLKGLPPLQFRNQSLKSAWLKSPIIWM